MSESDADTVTYRELIDTNASNEPSFGTESPSCVQLVQRPPSPLNASEAWSDVFINNALAASRNLLTGEPWFDPEKNNAASLTELFHKGLGLGVGSPPKFLSHAEGSAGSSLLDLFPSIFGGIGGFTLPGSASASETTYPCISNSTDEQDASHQTAEPARQRQTNYQYRIERFLRDEYPVPLFLVEQYHIRDKEETAEDQSGFTTEIVEMSQPHDTDDSVTSPTIYPDENMIEHAAAPTETVRLRKNNRDWADPINALRDACSDGTFISTSYARELDLQVNRTYGEEVYFACGRRAPIHGFVKTSICWAYRNEVKSARWRFGVVDEESCKVIIGRDYITQMDLMNGSNLSPEQVPKRLLPSPNDLFGLKSSDSYSPTPPKRRYLYVIRLLTDPKKCARETEDLKRRAKGLSMRRKEKLGEKLRLQAIFREEKRARLREQDENAARRN